MRSDIDPYRSSDMDQPAYRARNFLYSESDTSFIGSIQVHGINLLDSYIGFRGNLVSLGRDHVLNLTR